MHAVLRGQPEQCEHAHMPSTSLSFNTSVARSDFFLPRDAIKNCLAWCTKGLRSS